MRALTMFLSVAVLSLLAVAARANGGLGAPCLGDSDCAGDRTCRAFNFNFDVALSGLELEQVLESVSGACEESSDYCLCFQDIEQLTPCRNDDSCLDSEECNPQIKQCVSKAQAEAVLDIQEGRDGAFCLLGRQCAEGRVCVELASIGDLSGGICLVKFTPSTSSSGDNAANGETADGDDASDDAEDDSSEICIAAKSLAHLQQKDLLYPSHIPARVLCDSYESCATPGHMVRYRGQPMMMKSYCELVGGCTRAVMHVNSPRYQRALDLPSDTPHLSFTAFAARYTSKLEEHVLRTAVRMGL